MDAGDRLHNTLQELKRVVNHYGIFSTDSGGRVADWTHPGLFTYFKADSEVYGHLANCDGALVAVTKKSEKYAAIVKQPSCRIGRTVL